MTHKNTALLASFFITIMFLVTNQGCAAHSVNTTTGNQVQIQDQIQTQTKSDLEITQDIRQAIIADQSLSMYAHNVKIISKNGIVKLRGPVSSAEERKVVVDIASHVTGMKTILDQMSVASK